MSCGPRLALPTTMPLLAEIFAGIVVMTSALLYLLSDDAPANYDACVRRVDALAGVRGADANRAADPAPDRR